MARPDPKTWFASLLICGSVAASASGQPSRVSEETRPELVLQTGHSKSIRSVAFGPGNALVATGSFDNSIRIWKVDSGQELRVLTGHTGAVTFVAFVADGTKLVSTANDKSLKVWNIASGKVEHATELEQVPVRTEVDSNGRRIAILAGSAITVREIGSGTVVSTIPAASNGFAFSPDGTTLAAAAADGRIATFSVDSGKQVKRYDSAPAGEIIGSVAFDPSGRHLVSADSNGLQLWNAVSGRRLGSRLPLGQGVVTLRFSPSGKLLAADNGGSIHSIDVAPTSLSFGGSFKAFSAAEEIPTIIFSDNGSLAAACDGRAVLDIVDVAVKAPAIRLGNHTTGSYDVAFSPNGRWLASAAFDNSIKLWDLQTGESRKPLSGHNGRVSQVAFLSDERRLVSASIDTTIRIWDLLTRRPIRTLSGHTAGIGALAVSADDKYAVSGSVDGSIGIWPLSEPGEPRFFREHTAEVAAVAITSDGSTVISGSADGTIRLWDLAAGKTTRPAIEPKAGRVDVLALSPDNKTLAAVAEDRVIRIWDLPSGRMTSFPAGHAKINSLTFSTDGTQLIAPAFDGEIRFLRLDDGSAIRSIKAHSGSVHSVAFLSSAGLMASASDDGSVSLWDLGSGNKAATLISLREGNDWLVVTPAGSFDGSRGAWSRLFWRFENSTLNVQPVEAYFTDFFAPGLLGNIVRRKWTAERVDITRKDRRHPKLTLAGSVERPGAREAILRINVGAAPAGARDVRLFRNGALVRVWRGDVLKGRSSVELSAAVPVVAGSNRFTAYAFNSDDVKSPDSSLTITGSTGLIRRGTSYILAIGINKYANSDYNLDQAGADAAEFADELKAQQARIGSLEKVEIIPLRDEQATRERIMSTLADLAKRIEPEDSLTIFFAGHGIARDKSYFIVPHDIGYLGKREEQRADDIGTIIDHSISDEALSTALEAVDARQMILVIDSCNSGQILETEETRRGPMNSKGLAQLAYDKGLYVLTASQSYQDAKEAVRLGNGYLTYALIEDGLRAGMADEDPKDGQILLREWLNYAVERVPQIDQEDRDRGVRVARKLEREKGRSTVQTDTGLQRPRVFYRREEEDQPFVVARR